jgi:DNA polymerase III subunit gamma/tau
MMNTLDFRMKYRPKKFSEVIGNKSIIQILKNIVTSLRIPNGILFHGPPGTVKSSLAYVFVKALNCLDFKEDVCGNCENCLLMEKYFPSGPCGIVEIHDCTIISENYLEDLIKRHFPIFPLNRVDKNIHVFDEFQRAKPSFQEKLLRPLETIPKLLLIFCLINLTRVEEAFQQRVTILKTTRPELDELVPWLHGICSLEGITVKDARALKDLAIAAELLPRQCLSFLQKISYLSNTLTADLVKQVSKDNRSVHEDASTPILIE